ncbi:MAG: hypothetical protein C0456_18735 [Hyphomonas sp.]|jgi:CubicO group peptidase (beta-lactamase class C family)|nr:hypothetical protein [Sphingobium sp.]MBA4165206.1 hypothetical protein [Erythrobacter sp.]MBA4228646.1 hypothetical protein [Hyphomonas sp.]
MTSKTTIGERGKGAAMPKSGWGGFFAFADPERGWAVAYTMNRMGADLIGDPRSFALVDVLYRVPDGTM